VTARPDLGEQLPGAAPEQQGAGVEHLAEAERVAGDDLRAVPERPTALRGPVAPVRVVRDPVQGYELNDDDSAHDCPPWLVPAWKTSGRPGRGQRASDNCAICFSAPQRPGRGRAW